MAELEAILLGELESLPESVLRFGLGRAGRTVDLPIYSFLVRSGSPQRLIVFDLGCPPPDLSAARGHRAVSTSHRTIGAALRERGVDPAAVELVVLSHLHWDHCYGLAELPNAEIVVQRAELQYAFAPHPEQWRPYESFELGMVPDWLGCLDRVRPIDGAARLSGDVTVVPLPGHTPGSQGLVVDRGGQMFVCCGDHLVTYDNVMTSPRPGRAGAAVPPGVHVDLISWRESVSRVAEAGWVPLPAHEARVEAVLAGEYRPDTWLETDRPADRGDPTESVRG